MKICVLVSFAPEIKPIVSTFHLGTPEKYFYTKKWKGSEFTLIETGIGKVNASAVTQIVIQTEHPDVLINIGCSGGFKNEVQIGDIVLPAEVIQFDIDQHIIGEPLGLINGINKIKLPLYELKGFNSKYKRGVCITGDQLIWSNAMAKKLYKQFKPSIADMELGAIAQVCYLNQVKLISIKCPTDIVERVDIVNYAQNAEQFAKNMESSISKGIVVLKEVLKYLQK